MKKAAYLVLGMLITFCIVLFLALLGFKFIYAPNLQNDWGAIGAVGGWVGVIISSTLTWLIIFQTKKLSEKENKVKELDLKINLYDKRYKIYECFNKYFEPSSASITAATPSNSGQSTPALKLFIDCLIDTEEHKSKAKQIRLLDNEIFQTRNPGSKAQLEKNKA